MTFKLSALEETCYLGCTFINSEGTLYNSGATNRVSRVQSQCRLELGCIYVCHWHKNCVSIRSQQARYLADLTQSWVRISPASQLSKWNALESSPCFLVFWLYRATAGRPCQCCSYIWILVLFLNSECIGSLRNTRRSGGVNCVRSPNSNQYWPFYVHYIHI